MKYRNEDKPLNFYFLSLLKTIILVFFNGLNKIKKNFDIQNKEKSKHFTTKKVILALILVLTIFAVIYSVESVSAVEKNINNTTGGGINKAVNDARSGDIINLDEGVYSGRDNRNININKTITIVGKKDRTKVIINAEGKDRIFTLTNKGTLTLINITLINGKSSDYGGAIYNKGGTLITNNCEFKNNKGVHGGAIYNNGTLNVVNTKFSNNNASAENNKDNLEGCGGAIYNKGVMDIKSSDFLDNMNYPHGNHETNGGAIYNSGVATIIGTNFINNRAEFKNKVSHGGAIYNEKGTLNVSYSVFWNNSAKDGLSIYKDKGTVIADFNWWCSNDKSHVLSQVKNVRINNYYTISLITNSSNPMDVSVAEPFFYTFKMYLNGTNKSGYLNKLPYLNASITHPNNTTEYFDARTQPTWDYTPKTNGIYTVKSKLHCQELSLKFEAKLKELNIVYTGDTKSTYNKNATLKAKVTDKKGNGLKGIKVNFWVKGKYVGFNYTDANGIAILNYLCKFVGKLPVCVATCNSSYKRDSASSYLCVKPAKTKIFIENFIGKYNLSTVLNATLFDEYGNPLKGFTIDFYVKGKYVGSNTTNNKGTAFLTYDCNYVGTFCVTAKFNKTSCYYFKSKNTSSIKISPINTKINIEDFNGKYNKDIVLNATLFDEYGKPLKGVTIDFYVNRTYVGSNTTNEDGMAFLTYDCKDVGTFNVTAKFNKTCYYSKSINTTNLFVDKLNTKIIIDGPSSITVNESSQYKITLLDEDDKPIPYQNVIIYIDGKTFNLTTDENGIVFFSYTFTTSGNMSINALFEGTNNYYSSNNVTFTNVNKISTKITIIGEDEVEGNKTVEYLAILTDEDGNPLANKTIIVTIDGTEYSGLTDENGYFFFEHTFTTSGIANILVNFNGDEIYNESSDSMEVTVKETPNPPYNPQPTPTPKPKSDSNITSDLKEKKYATGNEASSAISSAAMKTTGIPLIAILICLIGIFGAYVPRKKQ